MRLPDTLDTGSFAEAELCAVRLDGDAFGLGRAIVPADVPVVAAVRAASLAPAVTPHRLVAETWTAAWVHGAWPTLPDPLTLAVDMRRRGRTRAVHPPPREARFRLGDVEILGGVLVVSPFRTAFDLARMTEAFEGPVVDVVRSLLDLAGLDAASAATEALRMEPYPNKTRAFDRLLALGRS